MYCAERLDFILNHLDELQHDITIDNQIIEVLRDEKTPETFLLRLFYKILENESKTPPVRWFIEGFARHPRCPREILSFMDEQAKNSPVYEADWLIRQKATPDEIFWHVLAAIADHPFAPKELLIGLAKNDVFFSHLIERNIAGQERFFNEVIHEILSDDDLFDNKILESFENQIVHHPSKQFLLTKLLGKGILDDQNSAKAIERLLEINKNFFDLVTNQENEAWFNRIISRKSTPEWIIEKILLNSNIRIYESFFQRESLPEYIVDIIIKKSLQWNDYPNLISLLRSNIDLSEEKLLYLEKHFREHKDLLLIADSLYGHPKMPKQVFEHVKNEKIILLCAPNELRVPLIREKIRQMKENQKTDDSLKILGYAKNLPEDLTYEIAQMRHEIFNSISSAAKCTFYQNNKEIMERIIMEEQGRYLDKDIEAILRQTAYSAKFIEFLCQFFEKNEEKFNKEKYDAIKEKLFDLAINAQGTFSKNFVNLVILNHFFDEPMDYRSSKEIKMLLNKMDVSPALLVLLSKNSSPEVRWAALEHPNFIPALRKTINEHFLGKWEKECFEYKNGTRSVSL